MGENQIQVQKAKFSWVSAQPMGTIFEILSKSYENFFTIENDLKDTWEDTWAEYDQEVSEYPTSLGNCGFFTKIRGKVVGFASFGSQDGGSLGTICNNCVLPDYRRKGLGMAQMRIILSILRAKGFEIAKVSTLEHPFFRPARRLYKKCGFKEERRFYPKRIKRFRIIDYYKLL